jgi:ABC-type polysaccharide/polyol phosphate export permease
VLWLFFTSTVTMSASTLIAHAYLVQQVRFPRQLLPLSVTATNVVTLLAMLLVVIPLDLAFVPATRTTFWAGLLMLVPLVAFAAGLALALACATVYFRDVEHLLQTVLLPWFFLTPIFYEFGSLPGVDDNPTVASALYWANPLTPVISAIRDPLFAGTLPRWQDALYACLAGVAALALGAIVFRRVDDQLAAEL